MSGNEDYDYRLSNGRTVIQDIYANLDEAVKGAEKMPKIWKRLNGKIDQRRFQYTLDNLTGYIEKARNTRNKMVECFEENTGRVSGLNGCDNLKTTEKHFQGGDKET